MSRYFKLKPISLRLGFALHSFTIGYFELPLFQTFLFPLTVQNNRVQLYDYDYKNNKKFVPGEGIPLPTKEILIMKTIFYSILAEPQKLSNFLNTGDTTWALWQNELWFHIKVRPILCMNFFFSDIFPCMNFFFGHFPLHEFFFGHFPLHEFFLVPPPPPPPSLF